MDNKIDLTFIYGHDGHLGHATQTKSTNVGLPYPGRLHMEFGFSRLDFRGKVFENVDGRQNLSDLEQKSKA